MKRLIDKFIEDHRYLRGSFHMSEQLRELVMKNNFNYFDASEYIANNYGYSI